MKKNKDKLPADDGRQAFLDATAVHLFARGWPDKNVYAQAERLWALRAAYIAQKAEQDQATLPAKLADSREVGS